MKKCPFCAEEIQDEAIKCKHCKNDLPSVKYNSSKNKLENKRIYKILGMIALAFFAIIIWYISIPAIAIWYFWKKTNLNKKTKIILTCLIIGISILTGSLISYANRAPIISIKEPGNNTTAENKEITIKGIVSPADSTLTLNNRNVDVDQRGNFETNVQLPEESNAFNIIAANGKKTSTESLTILRNLTDEEKAELERQKAEKEAKKQEALKAAAKARAEAAAQAKAEQDAYERTKAGKLCKAHPLWTKEECQKIADNKIWIGMTLDMLKALLGTPNSANPSNYGSGTSWQWCWFNYSPSCFYDSDGDGIIDSYN